MKRRLLLQQDNDPKHTLKSSMDFLKMCKQKVLPWLSQSPNLNIIENLLIDLKRAVHARRPKNLIELEALHREEWAKIPQSWTEILLAGYKSIHKL